jgi:hypothetical protein
MHIMIYFTLKDSHNYKICKHMHRAQYTYIRVDQMRQLSKSSMFTTQRHVHRMYMELKLLYTIHIFLIIEHA